MKKLSKELLFGDSLNDVDLAGLDLNRIMNVDSLMNEDDNQNQNQNSRDNDDNNLMEGNSNQLYFSDFDEEKKLIKYDENDLNVSVLCTDDGEKIFKLTDLNIPLDEKAKENIENYLRRIINRVKKDKNEKIEKIEDIRKREKNEKEEIEKLMKRSKKNQKYCKVNIGYDEKFFDKTLFLKKNENCKEIENKSVMQIEEEKSKEENKKEYSNKIKTNYNYDDLIKNTLMQYNMNHLNNKINNQSDNNLNINDYNNKNEKNIESIIIREFMNIISKKTGDCEHNLDNNNENNTNNEELNKIFLDDKNFLNYSKRNSNIITELFPKNSDNNNNNIFNRNNNLFNFNASQSHSDKYDLQDFIKKKRNRASGYSNYFLSTGAYMNSYLKNSTSTKSYKDFSKIIYDLNDYNMNFEIIEEQKNNNPENSNTSNNITDFFSTLPKKSNVYSQNLKFGNSKGSFITHAKCAYNFTYNHINLTYEDLPDFHRPNFCKYLMKNKKKRVMSISINLEGNDDKNSDSKIKKYTCLLVSKSNLTQKERKLIGKNVQYMNSYEIFKNAKKLSLIDGKFALFEHIDEYPLFIANFGMSDKMKKYLYSTKLFITSNNQFNKNNNMKLNEIEQKTLNMMGPNGTQIILKPEQKLPLLGQIDQNEIKGINIIDNNMYRAPVFYEKISHPNSAINTSLNKKRYNFLITFTKNENGQKIFHIRELEHLYTVAQEEPKIEVYPPQSRQYNTFLKNKIETYTYMLYNVVGYKSGINFKIFQNLFPAVTEQILKRIFKEMNIEIDKNICYFKKLPGDINQKKISPENICQFESCQFGIYKLREVGIKNLTNADKISYATNKYINNQTTLPKEQYLAKVIEENLLTTPWNITQNYLQSKQIKGMLSIKGIGDPSNGNGGYSFLKMPVKSYNENKTLKEEMDVLKNQNKNIKTVTGTDADLRKLSKEDIKIKLIQLGIEEDVIQHLGRWKRVSLLRATSSHAVKLGYEGDIVKYARNQRYNTKTQREAYQRNINEVFKKQINYILNSDSIPLDENESENGGENGYNAMEIGEEEEGGMKYHFEDEMDNRKKNSMAFMRNEIYPNKKKK